MQASPVRARAVALATTRSDEGWGGVWPVAILVGSTSAAALAGGAWLGAFAAASGSALPPPATWLAEHALWGTALGAAVALGLRLGSSRNPELLLAARRRTVAARGTPAGVALAFAVALVAFSGSPGAVLAPAVGALTGAALWLLGVRLWLRGRGRLGALPRLDAARVAVLVAVVTLPLATAARGGPSLPEAWRAVLGS